jgi:tetratricopeptide (TPR) repeat protein
MLLISIALTLTSCSRDPQKAKAKYLAAGQKYMSKQQYGDAAIEFRNALRLDPQFVDAYYELAQATLAQHDWKLAYASLQRAIELDPNRVDARLDLGRLYLAAREFDKSEDEANSILKQDSSDVGAYQLLGAALIGEQKPEQALAALTKITELLPNNPSAYVTMALVEISLNRSTDAEQHLKMAIAVEPKATQAYADLADLYRLEQKDSQAQQVLQDGIAKNPDEISLYVQSAALLASEGKKDEADALLDTLGKQLPKSADAAVAIGDFYVQRSDIDRALAEYRRGLSVSPKNLDIEKRLQKVYLDTNQTQLATDLDRELTKDAPKDVIVRVDHGRLLIAQGKFADAASYLERVVADAADSSDAHYFLANAYWQNGEMGQANTALLDALKVSPNSSVVLQALFQLSLAQGNPSNASMYAQELVQKFPANPIDREMFANALAREGQLRSAEVQDVIAKQLALNDPAVHINLGQVYTAEKKWPQAQNEFESALELDPHNATALDQLANCLMARNQTSLAIARLQQYVAANPNDENGHLILGGLDFQSKNYGSAQSELERASQLDPKNVQAYLQLGKVYEAQGRGDLATASYQKALDLQPKFAPLATLVGNSYLEKGDLQDAQKYYDRALDSDPNFAVANANTAWIDAQEDKNLDVALGMAQKAESLMPDTPTITDTLAWVMYKRGDYTGAIPLLEGCVRKSPDSAEFHYHLGMALLATGGKAEAKEQIEAALRMKLDDDDARQAHEALEKVN